MLHFIRGVRPDPVRLHHRYSGRPRFLLFAARLGLRLNAFAVLLVLTGGVVAAAVHKLFDVPLPIILGVFSGAVTNTPALGAGQQILTDLGSDPALVDGMGMGYAMAYPFGICGILLVMWLIRLFFRINIEREAQAFESSPAISVSCCTP